MNSSHGGRAMSPASSTHRNSATCAAAAARMAFTAPAAPTAFKAAAPTAFTACRAPTASTAFKASTACRASAALAALAAGLLLLPHQVAGQQGEQARASVSFETDLPRTLVFIAEAGDGQVATGDMTRFLQAAGFPMIDPALAQTAAQRDLVQRALAGDLGAATDLGRDFGAQLLVIGRADWGVRPDQFGAITGTSEVTIRALRLDRGEVVSTERADARRAEATDQAARTAAIRAATRTILQETAFVGKLMNDWSDNGWQDAMYWRPDPGSIPAETAPSGSRSGPGLAILRADVAPSTLGATRGLGVVQRGARESSLFNPVILEGVVVGETSGVEIEGKQATLGPLRPGEARQLGLEGRNAQRFRAEMSLPMSQDTVRVSAVGSGGTTHALAAPRINNRWAVIIGIGEYSSSDIPNLDYAGADAQAMYDFLTSDAAGPFEPERILFLKDAEATGAAMREALFVFLQQAKWDDLVVIYYAGHGAPDPNRADNLYLLPHDSNLNSMASTGFPMWDVKTALRRQIAAERVIIIADACHSAGTRGDEPITADNAIAGGFAELFAPSRRLTITAADTNEFSFEDARWEGHGVFTYYLLEALRGEGDLNGDGIVTFNEAYEYVTEKVVAATGGRQNPQRAGWGDVPLAVVSADR